MIEYHNVKVVGMHFRGAEAKEIASALLEGNKLELVREPENPHDINAIKVIHPGTGIHIGYLEANQAAWIASTLDELEEGQVVNCEVTSFETTPKVVYPVVGITVD